MIYRTAKGVTMPALGLGTFELTGAEGIASIRSAIEYGYRHIDTAIRYGNEAEVTQCKTLDLQYMRREPTIPIEIMSNFRAEAHDKPPQ